jgi:hypothetical protein
MARFLGPLAAVLALGWSAPALAQDEPGEEGDERPGEGAETLEPPPGPGPGETRVAILILAARGVDPEIADALTELVIGAVAQRGGATIVGKEEFQSQLGQGEERSMECVGSTACLGRVGVQLDVDEVVAGTVGRRGQAWIFNINRIDIRSGELVGRTFREVTGDLGAVAAAIQDAVPTLYEAVRRPATLLVSANVDGAEVTIDGMLVGVYRGEPVAIPDVSPGRHEVTVSAPGHFEWQRAVNVAEGTSLQLEASLEAVRGPESAGGISPLFWTGMVVTIAAGATATTFGVLSRGDPPADASRAEAVRFVRNRRRDARIANASMGVAAAGVATAVIGLLLTDFGDEDEREERVDVGLAPVPRGGVLSVSGDL